MKAHNTEDCDIFAKIPPSVECFQDFLNRRTSQDVVGRGLVNVPPGFNHDVEVDEVISTRD